MSHVLFISGIQRVVRELISGLSQYDNLELTLLDYRERRGEFEILDLNGFLSSIGVEGKSSYSWPSKPGKRFLRIRDLETDSIFFDIDAVWGGKVKRSYLYPLLKKQGVRIVLNVYDIIPITNPEFCDPKMSFDFMDYIGAAIQYADDIIVNAVETKDDLLELCGRAGIAAPEISVTHLGADFYKGKQSDRISEDVPDSIRTELSDKRYILMVGSVDPRKNHQLLLNAYEENLKDAGYSIVIAGSIAPQGMEIAERVEKLKGQSEKTLFFYKGMPDAVINYLYEHARYVAFLSHKEGFGLPIIEALSHGTPVIASNTKVNRETGGEFCRYVDQNDPGALCDLIRLIDSDPCEYNDWKKQLEGYQFPRWKDACCEYYRKLIRMETTT